MTDGTNLLFSWPNSMTGWFYLSFNLTRITLREPIESTAIDEVDSDSM